MTLRDYKEIFFHGYILSFATILAIALSFDIFIHNYDDAILETFTLLILILLYYFWKKSHHKNIYAIALSWLSALFGGIIVIAYDFTLETPFFLLFIPFAFLYLLDRKTLFVHLGLYYALSIGLMIWGYLYSDNRLFFNNPLHLMVWGSLFLFILSIGIFNYLMLSRSFKYLEDSNTQKDILLQEVHHRVKNNLNMMSSMIGLQETYNDPHIETFVTDYRQRLNAIALIHDLLYQNNDYEKIDFQNYATRLGDYLIISCASTHTEINIDAEHITLPLQMMTNIGLILQELISNSLKHADNDTLTIYISLVSEKENYHLRYKDNGSSRATSTEKHTLGLQLVSLKVKELKGIMHIDKKQIHGQGIMYDYRIRFPHAK